MSTMLQKIKRNLSSKSEEKIRKKVERRYKKEYERIQSLLEKANERNAKLERELEVKNLIIADLRNREREQLVNDEKTIGVNKELNNNVVQFDSKQRISKLG
ncbi:hypothetical protein [Priestia aryabhattai]